MREREKGCLIFGARVRKLLAERKLEWKDLAEGINLSKIKINNYIQGYARPPLEVLKNIADFLAVSVDHLIAEEVNEDDFKIHMLQRAYTGASPEDKEYIMGMVKIMLEEIQGDNTERG